MNSKRTLPRLTLSGRSRIARSGWNRLRTAGHARRRLPAAGRLQPTRRPRLWQQRHRAVWPARRGRGARRQCGSARRAGVHRGALGARDRRRDGAGPPPCDKPMPWSVLRQDTLHEMVDVMGEVRHFEGDSRDHFQWGSTYGPKW